MSLSDRNLLFGILAMQMDLITREHLVSATSKWLTDKNLPIEQILLEQGALSESDRDLIAPLVARHIENHGGDPAQSLAALSSIASSLCEQLATLGDGDIELSLTRVRTPGQTADDSTMMRSSGSGMEIGSGSAVGGRRVVERFRILRPHARGGLGQVSVALDEELNREVAFKEILPQHADNPDSRFRFLLEAEITGGLEHPGIVPVYGLGQYEDGRPFYAMRFIRGDSLREAADRFRRDASSRDRPFESLEFRKLLGRFVDVCHAIGYAHARGVLHRDLKPGNVMLGKYGETLVVDWGLAKPVGRGSADEATEEATLQPRSASGSGTGSVPTMMGSAIGTPGYMPPEQAAGRLDELGPASDVYSLGATLYYLLAGRPPVQGKDVGEVLRKVERGDFLAAREIDGRIPAPLETICGKAMALRPSDRYRSAKDLADEVERYLADEPVLAHRDPLAVRARRWARKHRVLVGSTAAAAAVLLVALGVVAALQSVHRRELAERNTKLIRANHDLAVSNEKERKARQEADEQRERAEEQKRQAELARREAEEQARIAQAVNDFLQNDMIRQTSSFAQAGQKIEVDPNLTLREALDRAAERIGDRFQEHPLTEAAIQRAIGDAYVDVGQAKTAIPHLERSVELQKRELGEEDPATLNSTNSLALAYHVAGDLKKAIPLHEQTLKLQKAILGPKHPRTLTSINNLAGAYKDAGDLKKALSLLKQTLELMKAILGPRHPDTLTSMNNLGGAYKDAGDLKKAIPLLEQTLELQKEILGPRHPRTLTSMNNLGGAYKDAGDLKKALPLLKQTLELMKAILGPRHPDTLMSMNNLAVAYWRMKRLDRSIPLFEEVLQLRTDTLGVDHPDTLLSAANLGVNYCDAGRLDEGIPLLERAYCTIDRNPQFAGFVPRLLNAYLRTGRKADAAKLISEGLARARKQLPANSPQLGGVLASTGAQLIQLEQYATAEPILRECLEIRQKLDPDAWTTHNARVLVGAALLGQAEKLLGKRKHPPKDAADDKRAGVDGGGINKDDKKESGDGTKGAVGSGTRQEVTAEVKAKADKLLAEAEPLLVAGYDGLKKTEATIPAQGKQHIELVRRALVRLYRLMGKPDQAAKYEAQAVPPADHEQATGRPGEPDMQPIEG